MVRGEMEMRGAVEFKERKIAYTSGKEIIHG
jgi:hypothetical protein